MVAPVAPGDVIDGKYRVERVLGEGGMGVVVAALHMHLRDRVAIKFLQVEKDPDGSSRRRFAREARASARLKNEHVVRVLDFGVFEGETPAIVMEYLEGEDLSQVLARQGPLPVDRAVDYVLQACEAIAEAHSRGIVHRDLKPSNLFLAQTGDGTSQIKVLDFGISKLLRQDDESQAMQPITKTNAVVGSPLYMTPEQLSGTSVDARTDVWGMGVILYELLAGTPPFEARSPALLFTSILTKDPRRIREVRPEIPEAVEDVLQRCLEKEPAARFESILEFAHALSASVESTRNSLINLERISRYLLSESPSEESTAHVEAELRETGDCLSLTAWKRTSLATHPKQPRRWWIGVIAALAMGLAGTVAYSLSRSSPAPGDESVTGSDSSVAQSPPVTELLTASAASSMHPQAEDGASSEPPSVSAPSAEPAKTRRHTVAVTPPRIATSSPPVASPPAATKRPPPPALTERE